MFGKNRLIRLVLIGALALAAGLAIGMGSRAWAEEGDGSSASGSVVTLGDDGQGSAGYDEGPAYDAGVSSVPPAQEQGASEGPVPLDAEGNRINDGQVSDSSFLYDAAIADLATADSYYDGQTVQVCGEAVGEAIKMDGSDDLVWITLFDGDSGSSVAVVMARSDAESIDTYGAYGKTGTRLRVQGTYNLACGEHEGESDIHAEKVIVEAQGFVHPDEFDAKDFLPGIVAVVAGAFAMAAFWYVRERSR